MTFSYEDVNVVHFSGPISLTKWVLDAEHDGQSFDEFAKTTILQSYLDILDKDPKRGAKAARGSVKARLREVATVATQEWYEMYEKLLVDLPTISSLIEKERSKEEEEGDGGTRKSASRTQAKNTRKNTSAGQSAKKVKTQGKTRGHGRQAKDGEKRRSDPSRFATDLDGWEPLVGTESCRACSS